MIQDWLGLSVDTVKEKDDLVAAIFADTLLPSDSSFEVMSTVLVNRTCSSINRILLFTHTMNESRRDSVER